MSSPAPTLHAVACPICQGSDQRVVYTLGRSDAERRTVVECPRCALLFVSPRISSEDIAANYTNDSYFERNESATGYRNYLEDRDLHLMFFRRQLDELERLTPKGALLDVGCAGGFLVQEAARRGWNARGVELSPFASRYAREELGLDVTTGLLRDARFPDAAFRAVFMDDVIEHFEDPAVEAAEVARILEPGGYFVLHTPNAASPWRTLMGRRWVHLKPDEHLFYFDPASLTKLLSRAGFEIVSARACSKATNLHYMNGVAGKILPGPAAWADRVFGRAAFWRKPFPFRGGGMQVVARKRLHHPDTP